MRRVEIFLWSQKHPRIVIVGVFFACNVVIATTLFFPRHHDLRVSFFDVGQGDAVLIEAPNGNQLLYDAGPPSGASLRALSRELSFWDRSIDMAMLSHPDMDHIGGFPEVFSRYDVAVAFEPGTPSDNGLYEETIDRIATEKATHIIARAGMQIELGGGVTADVLYPDHDASGMETNSASIVLLVRYGETAFLLSGDLPKNIETYLVGVYGDRLRANVLKLGHHGSRTSSGEEWLRAVAPDVAVISAGRDNRYGHPHKEVIQLLEKLNIPVYKTYEEGTITFSSDGKTITQI